jgi:FkbM family methyltransferase
MLFPTARRSDGVIGRLRGFVRQHGYDVVRYPAPMGFGSQLRGLLDSLDVNCVLDVGARHGDYGLHLRRLGYEGRIVSFEPVAQNYAVLREQVDDRWLIHQLALGSQTERLVIARSAEPGCDSFLRPTEYGLTHFGDRLRPVAEEEVEVTTLDAVFDASVRGLTGPTVLLKIDTQGWDREVLRGAETSLKHVAALQLELSVIGLYEGEPSYLDQLSFAAARGFAPIWFEPVILDRSRQPPAFDCLLRRTAVRLPDDSA